MQDIKFRIIPKDKKLFKSSRVREYFKHIEKIIAKELIEQNFESKVAESIALGVPLKINNDGTIEVVRDFYKKDKKCTTRKT